MLARSGMNAAVEHADAERQGAAPPRRSRAGVLEHQAAAVEAAALSVQREKAALSQQYSQKIRELGEAKKKLEAQVG